MLNKRLMAIKLRSPATAEWIEDWQATFERPYDFSSPADRDMFCQGLEEMGKHITHAALHASLITVLSTDGVTTLFVNITPTPLQG